jgi:hypothetical protein
MYSIAVIFMSASCFMVSHINGISLSYSLHYPQCINDRNLCGVFYCWQSGLSKEFLTPTILALGRPNLITRSFDCSAAVIENDGLFVSDM